MDIIEGQFGNEGYAAWWKLLELLGDTEGHYYDCGNPINMRFLATKMRVSEGFRDGFMALLVELEAIDGALWTYHKVIWCQHFVDRLTEVYRKRRQELPVKPCFRDENPSTPVVPVAEMPQSRVEESRVEENKEKRKAQAPLVLPDWIPLETWNAFLEMRKSEKHPASMRAQELIISDLTKFKEKGYDPVAILNKSIKNSWRDVFEPKDGGLPNGKRKDDSGHVNVFHTTRLSNAGNG